MNRQSVVEGNSVAVNEEIPQVLRKPEVHHHSQNSLTISLP
jgi:hypothetical protein